MIPNIKIGNFNLGSNFEPIIVAEMSGNHNQSLDKALKIVKEVAKTGAHALKIQTYTADTITIKRDREEFQVKGSLWDGYNLYDLYKEAETPYEWHKYLFDYAKKIDITIFSSPFDFTAVDLLEKLEAPAYKIASPEINHIPLIKRVAQTGKPMIISTGMANLKEIGEAVQVARKNGCQDLVLLHCISSYPAPVEQSNLRTIPDLAERFGILSGLSDHTMGTTVATTSVALGACVIEKHFTLSRNDKGPDSEFSLEPDELKRLCQDTKIAWQSLGVVDYNLKESEEIGYGSRRSLYAVQDIQQGEKFTKDNIRSIRPGLGLKPKYYEQILGKVAKCDIGYGTPLSLDIIL